ncbi:protein phosphatase 2C domain-containing protein [Nocardioides sp.]|uniref:protein phosphatase 2C domain-containing protein n=1 Tax=Nocardioides sp. TaxID=35761 RepID=UPI00271E34FA|nr:protein phosphatase 2C domain-containing protein [Nocardioides sp.]MDO9456637.1 protein phosphatase 2C domain-containing protein [Nocardioides sp.]
MNCPHCAEPLADGAAFCEACGKPVGGAAPAAAAAPVDVSQEASPFEMTAATRGPGARAAATSGPRPCFQCGATVGPDGYCESCGTKQPTERDHFREQPVPWVAGVCDRGIRHSRNEDAMALHATAQGGDRAVLVVLDGVSNTDDSHLASLAGAKAARDVLLTPLPAGMGTDESRNSAVKRVFSDSVQAAQAAIVALTPEGSTKPPSATYVVGVLEGTRLYVANIGDSRAYWLPDGQPGVQLSVDDSVAQAQIAAGMDRKAAEEGPQGHAITRWLGIDAPDLVPHLTETVVTGPGWVLVCSDGLWNYASEPSLLVEQVTAAATTDPMALAVALVAFANGRGGQDNITAALARVEAAPTEAAPADPAAGQNAATDQQAEGEGQADG